MAQKPETKFRNRIMPILQALPNSFFESIQQKSIRGTPDIIGCVSGTFVAIEFKSSDNAKISEMQSYKLQKIVDAGGIGLIMTPKRWRDGYMALKTLSEIYNEV